MSTKVLADDLDNCLINFDRKVLVTNLLDEYGGLLEEIAHTVNEFLSAEEAKGKKFEKTFLLRGVQPDSTNEVITVVSEEKLKEREQELKDASSMLYSAETAGGSKAPPSEFLPLKHLSVKLDSLVVKDASPVASNGFATAAVSVKEEKQPAKKAGTVGAMFKKQESTSTAKKSPEKSTPKKAEPERKAGALGAMFKKQETAAASKKNSKTEPEKKSNSAAGAMFKKQESTAAKKSPEQEKTAAKSKKGMTSFLTKKDDTEKPQSSVIKPPTPRKMNEFFKKDDAKKLKEEPQVADVSVNLFEDSSSSGDEEALDKLKRELLTDEEDDKPSTSKKRRRIIDSDEEDPEPDVKVERKDVEVDNDVEMSQVSETFMDEDGFIVTVKAKAKKPTPVSKPNSNPTPVKIKKESPKSPKQVKPAASKTPAAKKKQGNIMSFFNKK